MTSSLWQKAKTNQILLMKEESEKAGLKLNIKKTKIMSSSPIISWQINGEIMETVTDFIFLGSKITADVDSSLKIKRCLLLSQSQKAKYCMIPLQYPKQANSQKKGGRKWQPTPVFLLGESCGQRSLVGCRLWGRTELNMTKATQQQQQHRRKNRLAFARSCEKRKMKCCCSTCIKSQLCKNE